MRSAMAISALVAAALVSSAQGSVVTATFNNVSPGTGVNVSSNGGGSFGGTTAGVFNWTATGGDSGIVGQFTTFCIELTQHISGGNSYTYTLTAPASAPIPGLGFSPMGPRANLLAELYGRFYPTLNLSNASDTAAFQLAVWEISNDNNATLDLTTGNFQAQNGGTYFATAQNWLSQLDGTGPTLSITALSSNTVQDQIYVPAPAAAGLLGFAGLAASRRRR